MLRPASSTGTIGMPSAENQFAFATVVPNGKFLKNGSDESNRLNFCGRLLGLGILCCPAASCGSSAGSGTGRPVSEGIGAKASSTALG